VVVWLPGVACVVRCGCISPSFSGWPSGYFCHFSVVCRCCWIRYSRIFGASFFFWCFCVPFSLGVVSLQPRLWGSGCSPLVVVCRSSVSAASFVYYVLFSLFLFYLYILYLSLKKKPFFYW